MKKVFRNFLIGSGIFTGITASLGAASYYFTHKLMKIALDRTDGKIPDDFVNDLAETKPKITGVKIPPEFIEIRRNSAKLLEEKEMEPVSITAHDGETLVAHWYECENAKRTIIAMHGWRSTFASDFGVISGFWHENDCNVLYVEQRGQSNSGGEYMGFGLIERYDCKSWADWIAENHGEELPVYLCGLSMGATSVLMASELELPECVKGIIADCGFTSPHEIFKHVAEKNMHLFYDGILENIANDICRKKIQVGSKDGSATDALKNSKVPVLFIHGTDDHFVPVEMTYENYKACASPKRLFIVPGADHGMSYFLEKEKYEHEVKKFWEEFK